jgi:hypothetical protein
MLRSQDVPCRLVTGFACTEWDEAGRVLTVRAKHAHAWVEVLDPAGFWYAVDPSPAAAASTLTPAAGLLDRLAGLAGSLWAEIAAFDGDARAAALGWLRALPATLLARAAAHPWAAAALLAIALLLPIGRVALRRREPRAVRVWRRAVAGAGLRPSAGETPRELLERAGAGGASERARARLALATALHERSRYAGQA